METIKRLLFIEFCLFLFVGWIVFCGYFVVWLFWYGGVVPFNATTWFAITAAICLAVNLLAVYETWKDERDAK